MPRSHSLKRIGRGSIHSRKDAWINRAAIWMAAAHRRAEIVAFLINQGVDVNANNGKALQNAAFHGDVKVVDMLLAAGAKAKNKALQWAAMENHAEVVDRLLQAGADLHVEDDFCLWMAASTGDIPMMEVILRHGADPETPCIKGAIEKYAHLRAWMDRRKIEAFCEEQEAGVGRKAVIARARV